MNISKTIEDQIAALEKAQEMAFAKNDPEMATSISLTILEYIKHIDGPDCDCNNDYDEDYICPDCEETLAKEMLHQEIADESDLPIELVRRVLNAQDEVLNGYDE